MRGDDGELLLEQKGDAGEAPFVKSCCAELEHRGYPAPCGYCSAHCVAFWYGTLYIGCDAIDSSLCNRPRDWGGARRGSA